MLEWNIVKIDRWRDNDTIIRIDCVVCAQKNNTGIVAEEYAGIEFKHHLSTNKIPYNQLSEEELFKWIWKVIDRAEWESRVLRKLEVLSNDNH